MPKMIGSAFSKHDGSGGGRGAAIVAAIVVGLIYFGRDVLLPIALAVLLSFVLAPLVRTLQKCWIPRAVAVVVVVLLTFMAMFAIGGTIAVEATQLAGDLPRYKSTIDAKIGSFHTAIASGGRFARAAAVLEDLGTEISKPVAAGMNALSMAQSPQQATQPVEVRQAPAGPFERLGSVISDLLHPLATTGITFTYLVFILLKREDLRNRIIKLAGTRDLQKTTAALDDAARRLSRLLLAQLAVNAAFGAVIGTGLWIIGVPSPVLWGILSAILRFVPFIGAWIAAVFPLTLAIAAQPGWSIVILTAVLFISVDVFVGNLVEPLLFGRSSGLSPVALVLSATFWTVVWGPVGLVLAAPMTICLVVMGRHVENLKFLDVMLGDEPPLSPPEIFYQRMLAGDPTEEIDRAEQFLKEQPLSAYYDDVALKGLKLAQNDLTRESLDPARAEKIRTSIGELIDELDELEDRTVLQTGTHDIKVTAVPASELQDGARVGLSPDRLIVCVAGRSKLEESAALMLAQLLGKHGLRARSHGPEALSALGILTLEKEGAAIVFLSYLDTSSPAHMRYAISRLRKRLPKTKILLGCWMSRGDTEDLRELVKADGIATTLSDALELCWHGV